MTFHAVEREQRQGGIHEKEDVMSNEPERVTYDKKFVDSVIYQLDVIRGALLDMDHQHLALYMEKLIRALGYDKFMIEDKARAALAGTE